MARKVRGGGGGRVGRAGHHIAGSQAEHRCPQRTPSCQGDCFRSPTDGLPSSVCHWNDLLRKTVVRGRQFPVGAHLATNNSKRSGQRNPRPVGGRQPASNSAATQNGRRRSRYARFDWLFVISNSAAICSALANKPQTDRGAGPRGFLPPLQPGRLGRRSLRRSERVQVAVIGADVDDAAGHGRGRESDSADGVAPEQRPAGGIQRVEVAGARADVDRPGGD